MMDVKGIIGGLRFFMKPMWRVVNEQIDAGYTSGSPDLPAGSAC